MIRSVTVQLRFSDKAFVCLDMLEMFPTAQNANKGLVSLSDYPRKGSVCVFILELSRRLFVVRRAESIGIYPLFFRWAVKSVDRHGRHGGYLLIEPLDDAAPVDWTDPAFEVSYPESDPDAMQRIEKENESC